MSAFEHLEVAPLDPILGITVKFKADTFPQKVDLGVGAYRTDDGKPLVLSSVKKAEKIILESNHNKEYLPIDGLPEFTNAAGSLIFGDDAQKYKGEKRLTSMQAISGTGSLGVAARFLKRFFPNSCVYLSDPTWGNHHSIFKLVDLEVKTYRYYNARTVGLDLDGMLEDLKAAPQGSFVLLHACAHNPTGIDPTPEQWEKIYEVIKGQGLFPFFDSAYQGFASGDLNRDAAAVRMFASRGSELIVTQSFAKNLGLYGERAGVLHVLCANQKNAEACLSQLKLVARAMYSNPPCHPARIVATILASPELRAEWEAELASMSQRIIDMRKALLAHLTKLGTPGKWDHIVSQIGMFSYTGLTPSQVSIMVEKFHVYLLGNGRISMAGLNSSNVEYVAKAIHEAVTSPGANL